VHQLVNRNFNNIKMHGMYVKIKYRSTPVIKIKKTGKLIPKSYCNNFALLKRNTKQHTKWMSTLYAGFSMRSVTEKREDERKQTKYWKESYMSSPLFWVIATSHLMICARRFRTAGWSHNQRPKCSTKKQTWPLKKEPPCCTETPGTNHPVTRSNSPEERIS
jgi:hypothetical protein